MNSLPLGQRLIYGLADYFFRGVGSFSLPNLLRISDYMYRLLYKTWGYHIPIVRQHLQAAFPDLSEKERLHIEKEFYQLFADFFIQTAYMWARDWDTVRERFEIREVKTYFHTYYQQGRNVVVAMGHQFNWEWGGWIVKKDTPFHILCVYLPLGSQAFDRLFFRLRARYGTEMLPLGKMGPRLIKARSMPTATILMADQSPSNLPESHWIPFLNQPTAWHGGLARFARLMNAVVLFVEIRKLARWEYAAFPQVLTEDPKALSPRSLTQMYVEKLETSIRQQPANWLWSHRRWKHKPPLA